jgi:copper(I)-binding protein
MPYRNTHTLVVFTLLSTLFLLSGNLYAHDHGNSKEQNSDARIHVKNARVNPIFTGMPVTAAYFDLHNKSNKDLTLVAVSGSISERIEIHQHTMINGLMKMQEVVNGVMLPAGEIIPFTPGGYHIMVMNLHQDIKEGDSVELTLQFTDNSTQRITATAKRPSLDHSSDHHPHKKHHDKKNSMTEHNKHSTGGTPAK